jgi:hypothetical protein
MAHVQTSMLSIIWNLALATWRMVFDVSRDIFLVKICQRPNASIDVYRFLILCSTRVSATETRERRSQYHCEDVWDDSQVNLHEQHIQESWQRCEDMSSESDVVWWRHILPTYVKKTIVLIQIFKVYMAVIISGLTLQFLVYSFIYPIQEFYIVIKNTVRYDMTTALSQNFWWGDKSR